VSVISKDTSSSLRSLMRTSCTVKLQARDRAQLVVFALQSGLAAQPPGSEATDRKPPA
jgi:hypothetical protein